MSSRSNQLQLRIGTLNCRSLEKFSHPSILPSFSRFLRTQPIQLYAFQEVSHRASTIDLSSTLNLHLQSSSSLWGKYCGLASRDPAIVITPIYFYASSRYIIATISHQQQLFDPFIIINIYAPALRALRPSFYTELLQQINQSVLQNPTGIHADFLDPEHMAPRRMVIVGDANLPSWRELQPHNTNHPWVSFIESHFTNVFLQSPFEDLPTFHRGTPNNPHPVFTTIDYMFTSNDIAHSAHSCDSLFVSQEWTDHNLLSFTLAVGNSTTGPGLWRANPLFARSDHFNTTFRDHLTKVYSDLNQTQSPQDQWDSIKSSISPFIRQYGRNQQKKTDRHHRSLQRRRNKYHRLLKLDPSNSGLLQLITSVESQLSNFQDDMVYIASLKSGTRWLEKGEKSAGFLKRTADTRQSQIRIHSIQHPLTLNSCNTPDSMHEATRTFYSALYSVDAINQDALHQILGFIPPSSVCSAAQSTRLQSPFSLDDIQAACYGSSKQSSPGMDGLPYDILRIMLCEPVLSNLVVQVYNQALDGLFPTSWQETCVILLPKKGDLSLLANWRPISLINTDAKIFTRLMTQRIQPICQDIINPFQTGFVKDRFIGDNGALVKTILDDARINHSSAFGIMLDQEKAYDRVHPQYLRAVLHKFGFPTPTVDCLIGLFFNTRISFNVNGFISSPIHQQRGLRQGDPLSPLLFNLAFEPMLRGIDYLLAGYQVCPRPIAGGASPPSVKFTAYADDVLVLCSSLQDFDFFYSVYSIYGLASNAKLNPAKSVAFTLTGQAPPRSIQDHLTSKGITQWYSFDDPTPLTYLGFPLLHNHRQRNLFLDKLLTTIKNHTDTHRDRQLSVLGRATVMNTLILPKLWHILRFLFVPSAYLQRLRSIIIKFTSCQHFPATGYAKLIKPKKDGGLGLLDPYAQQLALQLRLIRQILQPWRSLSPVLQPVVGFLLKHSCQKDPAIPAFFPKFRGRSAPTGSLWHMVFRSLDTLPRTPSPSIMLSASSWLGMPMGPFLLHDDGTGNFISGPSFHHSPFSSILMLDSSGDSLIWKPAGTLAPHYQSLISSVQEGILRLPPDIQHHIEDPDNYTSSTNDLSSLCDQMLDLPLPFLNLPTKVYRLLLGVPPTVRQGTTVSVDLPSTQWQLFWRWSMPHRVRTLWFRFLHQCLPSRDNLSRRMPSIFPSSICTICSNTIEDQDHLLFTCPVKAAFWSEFMHEFYRCPLPPVQPSTLCRSPMYTLQFLPLRENSTTLLKPHQVFAAAIHSIWQAHWRFTFDGKLITVTDLRLSTYQKLTILMHQTALKSPNSTLNTLFS